MFTRAFSQTILAAALLIVFGSAVSVASNCDTQFSQLLSVHKPGLTDPKIQKWLAWEISPTVAEWQQERPKSNASIVYIKGSSVEIQKLSDKDALGLERFLDNSSDHFPWLQHPYNTSHYVPHYSDKPDALFEVANTASRTVVAEMDGRLVSIKMPTDHPFGLARGVQDGKQILEGDLKYSVARSQLIAQVDQHIPADPKFVTLKEIAAVIDKESRNGYLFRDMTPLQDGNYYLPGHQIPYIGREIAKKNGQEFIAFWSEHWAAELGRFQAKLLYRYGLTVRSINPQNFLVQLDPQFRPTGVIIWRDLAESHIVKPIAEALGLEDYVARDMSNGDWGVHDYPVISSYTIAWKFDNVEDFKNSVAENTWMTRHNQAFLTELRETLGYDVGMDLIPYAAIVIENEGPKHINPLLVEKIKLWHKKHGR